MNYSSRDSSVIHRVEDSAIHLLQDLGYRYIPPEILDQERESRREALLVPRLKAAIRRLNPWISDQNVYHAVRALTHVQAASLLEANQAVHMALTLAGNVEQDRGQGRRSYDVRYIDFDDPAANEWIVTRQFRVQGGKREIIPDIVLFVNGLPLVVIECKSSKLIEGWLSKAVEQLLRYQEAESRHQDLGAPRLFHTVQLTMATCGVAAYYGTIATPERFYAAWKVPYPFIADEVARRVGKAEASAQDLLFYGMLMPPNLLDIVRNFVIFERGVAASRTVKKVARYQQFAAVNKAIQRAARTGDATERGGVVWHTQGSGKSLSMLWLATKLRRDPTHENPTIVIVTDRRDLDDQITRTFRACGFPNPEQAGSVQELRALLQGPGGITVLTTVQKFREVNGLDEDGKPVARQKHPVLSTASNLFVLTDEAHRTQYGSLAANLRLALPNAVFFAFTGTPIDKRDRSTLETFGSYIDTYSIKRAVEDEATVPIFYEGRLAEIRIAGQSLDRLFDRIFADRTLGEREEIKRRHAREQVMAEAPRRIETICLDLIDHYVKFIQPNGFKAQIVAVSREAAVTYKERLDELQAPESAVVITSDRKEARFAPYRLTPKEQKNVIQRFLDPKDPLAFLIVCDMLLTGFDAPVEQVMYLDAPLKEHTLLQAIARVNRKADGKGYGLVVDYWGVSDELQEALSIFAPEDVERALEPKADELPRLQARHANAMSFFGAVRNREDLERCVAVLEPDDVRADFELAFRRFSQSMELLLPDPKALEYAADLKWLGLIRAGARARFHRRMDLSDCGAKVRKLIEEAISADEVRQLAKPVSLFDADFEAKLGALKTDEAKASEMEHALRAEIHVRLQEDPLFHESLRERLERISESQKARRIDVARQLELLDALVREMQEREHVAEEAGLSDTGLALYSLLVAGPPDPGQIAQMRLPGRGKPLEDAKKALALVLEEQLDPLTRIVDWVRKDDVQREMRRVIKRQLDAAGTPKEDRERLAVAVVNLLRFRKG
jgi:type I restriction enzyme R subunit